MNNQNYIVDKDEEQPSFINRLGVSILATAIFGIIATIAIVIIIITLETNFYDSSILFSIFLSIISLLWNRTHTIGIYLFQCIICAFFLWLFIHIIPKLSTSIDSYIMVFTIILIIASFFIPVFQIFTNILAEKVGFQSKSNRSISFYYHNIRIKNNRKYHNEYIKYD